VSSDAARRLALAQRSCSKTATMAAVAVTRAVSTSNGTVPAALCPHAPRPRTPGNRPEHLGHIQHPDLAAAVLAVDAPDFVRDRFRSAAPSACAAWLWGTPRYRAAAVFAGSQPRAAIDAVAQAAHACGVGCNDDASALRPAASSRCASARPSERRSPCECPLFTGE
jgi:hypothetical protein